ncbi:uncharacterized protein RJT20DRAFT_131751 [Scheffersomyces xylosifermentans]|uniref:uncharacterized protein n=1 Tax=Scheffersomyces xylosifermentans TaxID=1304137 RepID=UPI00315CE6CF
MDCNTVESYHEFLNQMESCEFNNSLINLATSPSPESFPNVAPPTPHGPTAVGTTLSASGPTPIPTVPHRTYPHHSHLNLARAEVRPQTPSGNSSLENGPAPSSIRQGFEHPFWRAKAATLREPQLLNLNLHLDINTYYDKLTGLIYQIPFSHGPESITKPVQLKEKNEFNEDFSKSNSLPFTGKFIESAKSLSASPSCSDLFIHSASAPSPIYNEFITRCDYEREDDEYYSDDGAELVYDDEDDEDDEINPLAPGLFPKMNINDDEKFMKFDTLPLTPSYVAR